MEREYPFSCPNCAAHLTFDAEHPERPAICEYCNSSVYPPKELLAEIYRQKEENARKEQQRRAEAEARLEREWEERQRTEAQKRRMDEDLRRAAMERQQKENRRESIEEGIITFLKCVIFGPILFLLLKIGVPAGIILFLLFLILD